MRFSKKAGAAWRWWPLRQQARCSPLAVAPEVSAAAGGEGSAGATTITFLTGATDTDVASAKAVIDAFQAANPNITVKTRHPAGRFGG